jgi:hypothetical protein
MDAPFARRSGDRPAINASETADVTALVKTLDDGYRRQRAIRHAWALRAAHCHNPVTDFC